MLKWTNIGIERSPDGKGKDGEGKQWQKQCMERERMRINLQIMKSINLHILAVHQRLNIREIRSGHIYKAVDNQRQKGKMFETARYLYVGPRNKSFKWKKIRITANSKDEKSQGIIEWHCNVPIIANVTFHTQ